MTEQEQLEFNKMKEQNNYLLTWFDYFDRMEYSEYTTRNFYFIISGRPVAKLVKIISENKPITITYEKNSERRTLYLIAKNSTSEWKILTPSLDRPSANTPFTSTQGANFQKIIDLWANILKENIECWAKCYNYNVTINTEIPCLYQSYMWYYTRKGKKKIAHIHPYLREYHPLAFEELNTQLLTEGYIIKIEKYEEET